MRFKALLFSVAVIAFASISFQGCDKCTVSSPPIEFGDNLQYFSVTYLDTAGNNYLDGIYNTANVSVLFNGNAGYGGYTPYNEDLTDFKFGPFPYTLAPANAQLGKFYDYWYVIRKDTMGTDTFRLTFYPTVDECHEFWGTLEFYKNGVKLDQCSMQEICDITIVE